MIFKQATVSRFSKKNVRWQSGNVAKIGTTSHLPNLDHIHTRLCFQSLNMCRVITNKCQTLPGLVAAQKWLLASGDARQSHFRRCCPTLVRQNLGDILFEAEKKIYLERCKMPADIYSCFLPFCGSWYCSILIFCLSLKT